MNRRTILKPEDGVGPGVSHGICAMHQMQLMADHRVTQESTRKELSMPEHRDEVTALARLDPQALIVKAIESGAGIDLLERLVALAKEVRATQAKEAWYAAMAQFQAQCPKVCKTAVAKIQTARASYSYQYAPLDDILKVVQPVMGSLGLSVSWRMRIGPDGAAANCLVSHALGHTEESGDVIIPIEVGEDGRGPTSAQRVGVAMTYAKRYSFLARLGLSMERDSDGSRGSDVRAPESQEEDATSPGDSRCITEPQQKRFHAIARGVGWTEDQKHDLLTSFHCGSASEITRNDYDRIVDTLKKGPTPSSRQP